MGSSAQDQTVASYANCYISGPKPTFPHKPTQQDGASFKEMIPANINWIDRMVNFEKANPDNEYQTITKHFKHSFT